MLRGPSHLFALSLARDKKLHLGQGNSDRLLYKCALVEASAFNVVNSIWISLQTRNLYTCQEARVAFGPLQ
jgi:hypothetical protein